jgi:hypothetical protein
MTEAPFMMEQTTAYIALENFKIRDSLRLYLMNMEFLE